LAFTPTASDLRAQAFYRRKTGPSRLLEIGDRPPTIRHCDPYQETARRPLCRWRFDPLDQRLATARNRQVSNQGHGPEHTARNLSRSRAPAAIGIGASCASDGSDMATAAALLRLPASLGRHTRGAGMPKPKSQRARRWASIGVAVSATANARKKRIRTSETLQGVNGCDTRRGPKKHLKDPRSSVCPGVSPSSTVHAPTHGTLVRPTGYGSGACDRSAPSRAPVRESRKNRPTPWCYTSHCARPTQSRKGIGLLAFDRRSLQCVKIGALTDNGVDRSRLERIKRTPEMVFTGGVLGIFSHWARRLAHRLQDGATGKSWDTAKRPDDFVLNPLTYYIVRLRRWPSAPTSTILGRPGTSRPNGKDLAHGH